MLTTLQAAFSQVSNSIGIVSKYYGLVRPIAESGKAYLVSCLSDPDDCERGTIRAAVPDSGQDAISYVELRGNYTMQQISQHTRFTYRVRFVVWFNAAALGYSQCDSIDPVALKAYLCAVQAKQLTVAGTSQKARYRVDSATVSTDAQTIFSGQMYANKSALTTWPYSAFALEMDVTLDVPTNCITFALPDPVACP